MKTIIKKEYLITLFRKFINQFKLLGFEGLIWISALIYLALFNDPFHQHFTICPLANLGFEHCPGCGLGNSISLFFHGYFIESFKAHILGIPAILIILYRVFSLIHINKRSIISSSKSRSSYA
ncbi:MAG TPA: DUF2752 domain-containing protein [Ignavibacteriaceae bacterium]|jgi:hypothetical protein|nr:MAG: hypothetical protein BWY38_01175 [Ignavibacteria bacterium ADurb.Bin266]OQY74289.1 MAG: hypothetical protein B6D44_04870 [Ignavibacteriales bacterium UTCHB2]HQF43540.1 DUF2752 domain-containing protein [Ignavibacteriaceae bacterium]HQI40067.1 DUF2752 domain-containing protein [Ignavibacteriaceae bacterium]HQJ45206.1 DUF2752 domain-containing protein [Ignavibacteriaceae bacterium]